MRFTRQRQEETRLGITPLIDIVFLLLIFIVLTSRFNQAEEVPVSLPQLEGKFPSADSGRNRLVIDKQGRVYHKGNFVPREALPALIKSFVEGNPSFSLVLEADRDARYGTVVELMDIARRSGMGSIVIAAEWKAKREQ
ncbi:MAG: biopolymer transporter ExbD [Desulfobacteraceae bacterium]|jgi:biopolymer transport protein ExbD|nr:MAG: biopolymer transporter ExbD [Desulfobacteraceae bacterium]